MPFWGKSSSNSNSNPASQAPNPNPSASDHLKTSESPSSSDSTLTPNDIADNDLRDLLNALSNQNVEEEQTRAKTQRSSILHGTGSSKYQPTTEEKARFQGENFTTSFPTEMSCLDAFDRLWYCYSLGGQFLNAYRYGTLRDCSTELADLRFCMKTKVYGAATRRAMIYARNKEKAAKYKTVLSSEDIWSSRTEPVKHLFNGWSGESVN